MYTIGEVSKFLGVTRDALKFYEEKGLVNPKKDENNGYRIYSIVDICNILTVNFYKQVDFEIKQIQQIKDYKSIDEIELLLKEKEKKILEELEYKKLSLKRIKIMEDKIKKIKENLDEFSIREMKPIEVVGEIDKTDVLEEYGVLEETIEDLNEVVSLDGLSRIMYYDEKGIVKERYVLYKNLDDCDRGKVYNVISYPKCLYTVIAYNIIQTEINIDRVMEMRIKEIAKKNGYELLREIYVNLLFRVYEGEGNLMFYEVYAPMK